MAVDAGQVISRQLEAGESLLWSGRPRKGIVFRGSDVALIPFSLMWGGFAIFWETSVLWQARKDTGKVPLFVALWGIPFVLIGLYLIVGRFLIDARQREHTCYGVTNRRVIILTGPFDQQLRLNIATLIALVAGLGRLKVKSLDLRTMTDVSMAERSGGGGTITFGARSPNSFLAGTGWPGMNNSFATPSFDLIEHVKSVYELIRGAQRKTF